MKAAVVCLANFRMAQYQLQRARDILAQGYAADRLPERLGRFSEAMGAATRAGESILRIIKAHPEAPRFFTRLAAMSTEAGKVYWNAEEAVAHEQATATSAKVVPMPPRRVRVPARLRRARAANEVRA